MRVPRRCHWRHLLIISVCILFINSLLRILSFCNNGKHKEAFSVIFVTLKLTDIWENETKGPPEIKEIHDSSMANRSELTTFQNLTQKWLNKTYGGSENYMFYSKMRLGFSLADSHNSTVIVNDLASINFPIEVLPCASETKLLVGVMSAPKNTLKRATIRDTWKKNLNASTSLFVFILGRITNEMFGEILQINMEEESAMHDDIIQIDLEDSYKNLSQKSVAFSKWVDLNCPKAEFILKCDDDVYVNVRNLYSAMKNLPVDEQKIYGVRHFPAVIGRPSNSKRYINKIIYSFLFLI